MGYIRVYNAGTLIDQKALSGSRVTIGRTDDNGIVLRDPGVSRRHAAIVSEAGGWLIEDLGSSNGVFLNKSRIERQKLRYWDEIQIQQFVIRFMATPSMKPGEETDAEPAPVDEHDQTSFVSLQSKQDLERLRQQKRQTYVEYADGDGSQQRFVMHGLAISIGRSAQADIRVGGWFAPGVACRIERRDKEFEIVAMPRGKVEVEGERVESGVPIEDDTRFSVRGREFRFFHRLTD